MQDSRGRPHLYSACAACTAGLVHRLSTTAAPETYSDLKTRPRDRKPGLAQQPPRPVSRSGSTAIVKTQNQPPSIATRSQERSKSLDSFYFVGILQRLGLQTSTFDCLGQHQLAMEDNTADGLGAAGRDLVKPRARNLVDRDSATESQDCRRRQERGAVAGPALGLCPTTPRLPPPSPESQDCRRRRQRSSRQAPPGRRPTRTSLLRCRPPRAKSFYCRGRSSQARRSKTTPPSM